MRRFIKKIKNSILGKILKTIFKILLWVLEIIIIFIAIIIVTQRVTNDQEAFLGFRIYNVATGSMEPEYAVGDILISKEKEPSEINVGDNIVYLGDEAGYDGKIITHTVIEREQDENGDYLFHTKGIANTVEDPIVHEDQIYGVIVQNNIVLAWLCKILTNRYGLYFFVVIPIILYAFVGMVRAQGERMEQERLEREQKRLEHEKRKKKKMKNPPIKEQQENKVEFEDDNIEEVIEEPKTKKASPKKKKESEDITNKNDKEVKKETSKSTTKQTNKNSRSTAKTNSAVKQTEKKAKSEKIEQTEKKTKVEKTEKNKKDSEEPKKTPKKKNAQ